MSHLNLYQFATQSEPIDMSQVEGSAYPVLENTSSAYHWIHHKCTTLEQFDLINSCWDDDPDFNYRLYEDETIFRMFLLFVHEATSV